MGRFILFLISLLLPAYVFAQKWDADVFYKQTNCIDAGLSSGRLDSLIKVCSERALKIAPFFKDNWNYGNAIHKAYTVLGLLAVKNGEINSAEKYLIASAQIPGSPQLDTFGPNMILARELLLENRRNTVLVYLNLCRNFWKLGHDDIDAWSKSIQAHKIPDFKANLLY